MSGRRVMHRRGSWTLCVAALLATCLVASTADAAPNLRKVDARLRKAKVRAGSYALVVRERGPRGRVLVERGVDRSLVPASVAKVLTGAAALDVLGPGYEFATRLAARGEQQGEALHGDLVLIGSGDPTLGEGTKAEEILAIPTRFAQAVRAAGIRRVRGALIVDDSLFDRETFHPGWTDEDKRSAYGAGVSGLTFHHGCVRIEVTGAARAGAAAVVRTPTTTAGLRLKNQVKTVAGAKAALAAFVKDDTLVVKGKVPPKGRGVVQVPVAAPAKLAGLAFLSALARAGVEVTGGVRPVRQDDEGAPVRTIDVVHTPLRDIVDTMNVRSQNQYASQLFKALGAAEFGRGTWATGTRALSEALRRRGVAHDPSTQTPGVRIVDGSGLSIENRITAAALVQVLASFDGDPLRGPWLFRSLPTSGVKGTLRKRLRDKALKERVHAKTGTLGDVRVRSLAGYVDGRKGHPGYVFAIVLNKGAATHGVVDDVVRALFR